MNKMYVAVLCVIAMGFSEIAFAQSDQDFEIVREAANKALSEVPSNGYHVTADELLKKIQSGSTDYVIVDVRETLDKYKIGHIPGAIYINFKEIANKENLAKLQKDKDIILYCNTGSEENKALAALRMLGYKAYGLKFGYASWKKEKPSDVILSALKNADQSNYSVEQQGGFGYAIYLANEMKGWLDALNNQLTKILR